MTVALNNNVFSNGMFGLGDFWDKLPSWILEILKLPSFYSGSFKIFKNELEQFIPNHPPKHVITSTNETFLLEPDPTDCCQ